MNIINIYKALDGKLITIEFNVRNDIELRWYFQTYEHRHINARYVRYCMIHFGFSPLLKPLFENTEKIIKRRCKNLIKEVIL